MKVRPQAQWLSFLEKQSKLSVLIFSFLYTMLLGLVGYLIGYEASLTLFYLLPICLVSYFVSRRAALFLSCCAAATWLSADLAAGHVYSYSLTAYWNVGTRLVLFIGVAWLFWALRTSFDHERYLARRDFLTGAANSRAFYEIAEMELTRLRRYLRPFSVVHLDVDNFKTVNDTRGHHGGDDLLCLIVKTIGENLREIDVVARLGGDEFALLLPETSDDVAQIVVQKIQTQLRTAIQREDWPVSFSIGVLTCLQAPSSVDAMLKMVDALTYRAKNDGKNTIKFDVVSVR